MITETVTRLRATADQFGDLATATETSLRGVVIAPGSSTEVTGGQDTVTTAATLYAPAGTDLVPTDRVRRADGTVWQVDGQPRVWRSPFTGWQPGVEAPLRRVTG